MRKLNRRSGLESERNNSNLNLKYLANIFCFFYYYYLRTDIVWSVNHCLIKSKTKNSLFIPPAVPKAYRTVTSKPRYVPNRYFCVPVRYTLIRHILFCLHVRWGQKQVKATHFTFSDALELKCLTGLMLFIHLCLMTVHVLMQPWDLRLMRHILISGKRLIKGRKSPCDLNRCIISFSLLTCYSLT